jgi:glycosyltransferase involved in cell wall biosynthesis
MVKNNLRLQPWRYLSEVASGLAELGYEVAIITDENDKGQIQNLLNLVPIYPLASVRNPRWSRNAPLQAMLTHLGPDVILWHVGLLSFLHQRLEGPPKTPIIGIFTSPLYRPKHFFRLGIGKLATNYQLTTYHLIGSLLPRKLLRNCMKNSGLSSLVVQTETTRVQLGEQGLWFADIEMIPPGVDRAWLKTTPKNNGDLCNTLGYESRETLIVFYGSPEPLRGLPILVEAFNYAHKKNPSLHLLILSRRRPGELQQENSDLERLISSSQFHKYIQLIDGYLDQERLIDHVATADITVHPFELVPSDAPIAPLESAALGKPVLTTRVGCLPELVSGAECYLVEPADPIALSQALLQAAQERGTATGQTYNRTWQEMASEWSDLIQAL